MQHVMKIDDIEYVTDLIDIYNGAFFPYIVKRIPRRKINVYSLSHAIFEAEAFVRSIKNLESKGVNLNDPVFLLRNITEFPAIALHVDNKRYEWKFMPDISSI